MNYPSAAGGLKNMFVAQILVLVGGVLTVVGAVGAVFTLGLSAILLLPASLLMLVGGILEFWGLYKASADDQGYRGALLFVVVGVVLGIVGGVIAKEEGLLKTLLSVVQTVLNFLVVNAVCQTTSNLLHSMGKEELAEKGNTVSKICFICTVISVVCALVGAIPILNILAGLAGLVGGVITIVGYVLYLSFLSSGGRALEY